MIIQWPDENFFEKNRVVVLYILKTLRRDCKKKEYKNQRSDR